MSFFSHQLLTACTSVDFVHAGMGMEVICTVRNVGCFEIRKKEKEDDFIYVHFLESRLCCFPPSFAPLDTDILSLTVGADKDPCKICPLKFSQSRSSVVAAGAPPPYPALLASRPLPLAGAAAAPARPLRIPPSLIPPCRSTRWYPLTSLWPRGWGRTGGSPIHRRAPRRQQRWRRRRRRPRT
jgi:hypothetical protein